MYTITLTQKELEIIQRALFGLRMQANQDDDTNLFYEATAINIRLDEVQK
jgi:hypothetical protein